MSTEYHGKHVLTPVKHGNGTRLPSREYYSHYPKHLTITSRVWSLIDWLVYAVIISLIFVSTAGLYRVPSSSMEPTLQIGDTYIGEKLTSITHAAYKRGDIVVFNDSMGWMDGTPNEGGLLVKRIIGLPGDHVQVTSKQVLVNGKELTEDYLPVNVNPVAGKVMVNVHVPAGRLFVMGDNRGNSADSRFHMNLENGTIPVKSVIAVLKAQVLPLRGIHALK